MTNQAFGLQAVSGMPEVRAKRYQISGHSKSWRATFECAAPMRNWKRVFQAQSCLLLVLFLGLPVALSAQKQEGSWSDLRGLKVGQGIEVIEVSMKHHGGEFVSVSDEMLTMQEKGSDVSVKREDVVRVSTASGARRGEHAVIGLVVGAAIGAAVGAASGSNTGFLGGSSRGIAALVGIAIGGPTGAAIGATIPAHTTVYRASPAAASH